MQVIAKRTLKEFWLRHPQAETPLKVWYAQASRARWMAPSDIKDAFGTSVDFVGDDRVVFDISGNKYRLIVRVSYPFQRIMIKFVGTHKDYDRIDARTV